MNKRKIIALAMTLCMVAILAVGGTLAYLTDTDNDVNVFTVGNVKIEQYEKDRDGEDFKDQKLAPIVDDYKADGYHMGKNYADKIVTVKNTGTEAAYIRTFIAFPAALDDGPTTFDASLNVLHWNGASATDENKAADANMQNDWYWTEDKGNTDWPTASVNWDGYVVNIGGVDYNVYIATHKAAVAAGVTTAPNLLGVYLDATLDYDGSKYFVTRGDKKVEVQMPEEMKVLVASQAVQAEGFANAYDALEHAFGNPGVAASSTAAAFACPFGGTNVRPFN